MRQNFLRTAAALALILPALATTVAAQQKKDQGGAAPAVRAAPPPPAPHVAAPAPAPAPHIAAPVIQQQHIAAPVVQPHIAAPVAQTHIAAPTQHVAAPVHVEAQHVATPHVATPQIAHTNEGHANSVTAVTRQHGNGAITTVGEATHRGGATAGNIANQKAATANKTNAATTAVTGQNKAGPNKTEAIKTEANKIDTSKTGAGTPATKLANPNQTGPNTATPNAPNLVGQGPGTRGRNGVNQNAVNQPALAKAQDQAQAQARARLYVPGRKPILQNQAFANVATRDPALRTLAHATFQGGFAQFRDHDRRDRFAERRGFRGIVIGWGGPVFWPYAYDDFVDYTFSPYANDTFWPYAYDDVYDGIFGAYAPDATAYANVPGRRSAPRGQIVSGIVTGAAAGGTAQVCSGQASGLTDWPIERIAAQVQPTEQQRLLLDQLRDATGNALNLLQSTCATDLPSTPTGRLAAMHQRVASMLQAVQIVRPALDKFYQALSDEQKERFISLETEGTPKAARTANRQQPNLTQSCGAASKPITGLAIKQIGQVLRPNDAQQAALDALNNATLQAASLLKESCAQEAQDQPITPPARLAAMEARLNALLKAVDTVQPAMAKFYNSLTDEQKARFDRLSPRQA
jgi:LTXXQ motif family protein